jgi:hypothetical protein
VDARGRTLGVIGCDIEISDLSHFLKSLKIGQHGLAFIFNGKNELVAFPDAAKLTDPGEDGVIRPSRWRRWTGPAWPRPFVSTGSGGRAN